MKRMIGFIIMMGAGLAWGGEVVIAPAPAGEAISTSFTVTVDGKNVPVYRAKVAPADVKLRWKAMDDKVNSALYHDWASFGSFDMEGPVHVTVECQETVKEAKILPSSFGIKPKVEGKKVSFELDRPRQATLEINGNWVNSLHLFANPPERDAPKQGDPNVIYFGPGIHETEGVRVGSGQTVYLAAGAVVRGKFNGRRGGSVFTLEGDNITLRGRGIIDGGQLPTHSRNMIVVRGKNIRLEGVIVRDSSIWTIPVRQSDQVTIENMKLIGFRANSDGIDICNSRDVTVKGCFIRTLDDLVVIKTSPKGAGEAHNINVSGCVLWNEVAHALSIGAELRDDVSGVRFSDCDVIHDKGREWTLRVYHCDAARIRDVVFEKIRIEETRKFISLWIGQAIWSKDAERGHIEGVAFRDITAAGENPRVELKGSDAGHLVENARFENVVVNGKALTREEIKANEFVKGIEVTP